MKGFKKWLQLQEKNDGLWMRGAPRIEPGTKRKDAKDPYNHRFGSATGSVASATSPTG